MVSDDELMNMWKYFIVVTGNLQTAAFELARWVDKRAQIDIIEKRQRIAELEDALLVALPYVQDVLDDPEQLACFHKGVVQKHVKQIREALGKGD